MDQFLQQFLETTIDGAFLIDCHGEILMVNEAALSMFGYDRGELLGQNIKILTPSPIREDHDQFLQSFNPDKRKSHILGTSDILYGVKKDGSEFPVEIGISNFSKDGGCYFIGLVRDQSERYEHLNRITFLANHDPLTKLPNRTRFLEELMMRPAAHVALIDIVGFRALNLRLGHGLVDDLLCQIALRLNERFNGKMDMVARITSDKFAIYHSSHQSSECLGEELVDMFACPFIVNEQQFHLNCRVGLANVDCAGKISHDFLQQAEMALMQARQNGPDSYAVFDRHFMERSIRRDEIAKAIPQAIEDGEFAINLQPKIRQSDGKTVGAEVLVRWPDSKFGFISPAEFVPIAEQHGLVPLLDGWVFKQAVVYLKELRTKGHEDLEFAVNVSALNLRDPEITKKMKAVFEKNDLEASAIQIELTETALSDDMDQTVKALEQIKELGCSIAVDDFGTGYSSLSYLTELPLDYLKVDQSFVRHIPQDKKSVTVVKSLVQLAKGLGLKTIVEGVETIQHVEFLAQEKADYFQGFYFAKPMNKADFETHLSK